MAGLDYPFPVQYQELEGIGKLAFTEQEGKGPTILMIHGLGSYMPAWKKMIQSLNGRHVLAVDLPGYGKSSVPDTAVSLSLFAQAVEDLIEARGWQEVVLMGHSMGGQIALILALRQPDWLKSLVLLAPAGFETFDEKERHWLGQITRPDLLCAVTAEQILSNFRVNFFGNQLPEDARFMYEDRMSLRSDSLPYRAYCERVSQCISSMLEEPVFGRLSAISVPTLVLFGENDQLIPNRYLHPELQTREVARQGADRLADAEIHMLPSCGHFVLWDQADRVSELTLSFLEKKDILRE